jgi:hypothetical protein
MQGCDNPRLAWGSRDRDDLGLRAAEHSSIPKRAWYRSRLFNVASMRAAQEVGHLNWPQFDVNITIESIDHPECFPLVARRVRSPAFRASKARGSTGASTR